MAEQLTQREAAVLAAVGRRLGNPEIAADFHISLRTVESHIASLRRKLGVDSRATLIAAAAARRGGTVQLPHNSFVGRAEQLRTVRGLLERQRWVTVVGPPGCGKTRLALELAAAGDRAPVVAELADATPAGVPGVLARVLGVAADGAVDLVAACATALAGQPCLLVLDNCDRVAGAVGALVGELLAPAGPLRVLATSRSPVGGSDETVHLLPPLPLDGGAVRLFLDRAGTAAPDAGPPDGELVARICRRLDGLPLAIELAAARVRHLPPAELAARLEDGFGPLDRAGPGRHRSLETAFDWTWDLLEDVERAVLSRLAALPLTFDLALAEAVGGPGAAGVLLRLLDRSLVSPTAVPSDPRRFRLLDPLRAFVLDRTDPAVVRAVRRAHADHHAAAASALAARARTDDSRAAVEAAGRLAPEAVAALDWAVTAGDGLALPLAWSLAVLGEQHGPDAGGLAAIARAARDPRLRAAARPADLLGIGIALCYGDLDLVAELAGLALELAGDATADRLAAHHLAGYVAAYRRQTGSALAHLAEAERLADERLELWQLASARQARGIALTQVDPAGALVAFEAAMRSYALAGDAMHVHNARYMMAANAVAAGRPVAEAAAWAQECVEYARDSGHRHELAHALCTRGGLAAGPDAAADLAEARDIFAAVGDLRCLARVHLLLAARLPPAGQVPLLRQALAVAGRAHDTAHRIAALEALVRAHAAAGAAREAAVAFGGLAALVGADAAADRLPSGLAAELAGRAAAVQEGRARGPR